MNCIAFADEFVYRIGSFILQNSVDKIVVL